MKRAYTEEFRKMAVELSYNSDKPLTDICKECILVYINSVDFPLKISKHILKVQNDKEVSLYLVTTDLTLDSENMLKLYKKRWKIEEFFKSMKSNCSYSKSPTGTVKTQMNHFFFGLFCFQVRDFEEAFWI